MQPKIGEVYYHYKKPEQHYKIIGIALHTETEEEMVVYQPLYENAHALFVRPLKMFVEDVEVNGVKQPRFTIVQ